MSTCKRDSAEQLLPSKDHSPEQVKEVALMLYARRPFPLDSKSKVNLDLLVGRTFDFLDSLDAAYARVVIWTQ